MTDLQAVSLGGADLIAVRRIGKRFGSTVALLPDSANTVLGPNASIGVLAVHFPEPSRWNTVLFGLV